MKRFWLIILICTIISFGFVHSNKSNSLPDTIENVINSVVFVGCYDSNEVFKSGSGVIVSPNCILTAKHVIKDENDIRITLHNERVIDVNLIYFSEKDDYAFLIVPEMNDISVVVRNCGNLKIGSNVFAIGSPFGYDFFNSVTFGIISGLNRCYDEECYFIQTDAAINPGNSGGPVFNENGELIGIVIWKVYGEDMGFALPVSIINFNYEELTEQIKSEPEIVEKNNIFDFLFGWIK